MQTLSILLYLPSFRINESSNPSCDVVNEISHLLNGHFFICFLSFMMLLCLDLDFHQTVLHPLSYSQNNIRNFGHKNLWKFDSCTLSMTRLYQLRKGQASCYVRMNEAFGIGMGLTRRLNFTNVKAKFRLCLWIIFLKFRLENMLKICFHRCLK